MNVDLNRADIYYTFEEFMELQDDGNCYELHNGRLYMMSGVSNAHTIATGELITQLTISQRGKKCQVRHAPYDVRLWENEDTAYEPDVFVVCDPSKLKDKYCEGAPDFIAEVLSPSNSSNDLVRKFKDYREAGVKEYWIVDTEKKLVMAHRLIDKIYATEVYEASDKAPVQVLDGFEIELSYVFPNVPAE